MNSKSFDQTLDGRTQAGGSNDSLGEQLRRAREERGISLREIADNTRISMRHLEAIEANDYKNLPGGIFNRSFIKSYARQIGFNENAALEAYTRTARERGEPPEEATPLSHRPLVYTNGDSTRSPWINILLSVLMLGILVLGIYAALHWYQRTDNSPNNSGSNPAPTSTAEANTTPVVQPTLQPPISRFNVQVKANGEAVWFRVRVDESEDQPDFTLQANQTKEFTPERRLSLRYNKSKAGALEVTVNGRQAKTIDESEGNFAVKTITRENNP